MSRQGSLLNLLGKLLRKTRGANVIGTTGRILRFEVVELAQLGNDFDNGKCLRVGIAKHGNGKLGARHIRLNNDLLVHFEVCINCLLQLFCALDNGNAQRAALGRGLYHRVIAELLNDFLCAHFIGRTQRNRLRRRNAVFDVMNLRLGLVDSRSTRPNARTGIRQVNGFQKALHRAIFAVLAMQAQEGNIERTPNELNKVLGVRWIKLGNRKTSSTKRLARTLAGLQRDFPFAARTAREQSDLDVLRNEFHIPFFRQFGLIDTPKRVGLARSVIREEYTKATLPFRIIPSMTTAIETYAPSEFEALVKSLGQPRFRAKQLFQWIYGKGATSYDEMSNLPAAMRAQLAEEAPLHIPEVVDKRVSKDGSRKYLLKLADGNLIETVGIPSRDDNASGDPRRLSVCFSTQVGCSMACAFCATGTEGFTRNLLPGEMAQQLLAVSRDFGMRITNAVAMGQGEPFLNYDNVIAALKILNHPDGLAIGARHITVSTCGIVKGIRAFGVEPEQYTLALSLHSANQSTRDELMPRCASTPLPKLKDALKDYYEHAGRRISLEYLLIEGKNDDSAHIHALIDYCKGLHVHVNLLPMNDVEGSPFKATSKSTLNQWMRELEDAHIRVSIRDSRGSDIDGACGQLKNRLG